MKKLLFYLMLPFFVFAQSGFDVDDYAAFLKANENMSTQSILTAYPPPTTYYDNFGGTTNLNDFVFSDSVLLKYKLTPDELALLQKNHFVVTERLKFRAMGQAYHDVYVKDLPVMLTTDAVLNALHLSYDAILQDVEIAILVPNLEIFLLKLNDNYQALYEKYKNESQLSKALSDVDVYITIAQSLLQGKLLAPHVAEKTAVDNIWQAVQSENATKMSLFSDRARNIDFSQFTVRGHYSHYYWTESGEKWLGDYFKCMMWLGRIDFMLTPPPQNPWESPWTPEQLLRMNLGAMLLNELMTGAGTEELDENNEIITFLVGESDNFTPVEFNSVMGSLGIASAPDLLDTATYEKWQNKLTSSETFGQKILSQMLMMDPYNPTPGVLPVSYLIAGQRFIIDSYVFSNVVFDRVVYNGQKIWRPMPNPLDAMFVLGNQDALPLLQSELDTYHYASQLNGLRYLVDSYDDDFWDASLYNVWLSSLRAINPAADDSGFPYFMKTTAWHQQKLNTQLASWAQLRHDNLLYAKPSYTGMTGCSFPHTFIEPYPAFYAQIAKFAENANAYFSTFNDNSWEMHSIQSYFPKLENVMKKLQALAEKQVLGQLFDEADKKYLQEMLFQGGGSGQPPYTGWFSEIYYIPEDAASGDYVIADIHTQPTDQAGAVIGKVLHAGVGDINMGFFLAPAPTDNQKLMVFTGPVQSYYEKFTLNFDRLTDERWTQMVKAGDVPTRPDWVNSYLVDKNGAALPAGRVLPGKTYSGVYEQPTQTPVEFELLQNYPNPFNPQTTIEFALPHDSYVHAEIYDVNGRLVQNLFQGQKQAGRHTLVWNAANQPSGVYFTRLTIESNVKHLKMMLVK